MMRNDSTKLATFTSHYDLENISEGEGKTHVYRKDTMVNKTYLADEIIREFEENYERSAKSLPTSKSQNFVKKLVASLEKRNSDNRTGDCNADEEFFAKCYARSNGRSFVNSSRRSTLRELPFIEDIPEESIDARLCNVEFDKDDCQSWNFNGMIHEKKVSQKKSFKSILISMIKWRRSSAIEKTRRFRSCDNLDDKEPSYRRRSIGPGVPFGTSFSDEICERSATIHPIYDKARNEQRFKTFVKIPRKTNRSISEMPVNDSNECSVEYGVAKLWDGKRAVCDSLMTKKAGFNGNEFLQSTAV